MITLPTLKIALDPNILSDQLEYVSLQEIMGILSIHRIIVPEPELIEAFKIIKKNSVHIPTKKGRVGIRKKDLAIAMYGDDSKQNLTKLQRNITQKLKKPWYAIDIFDKVSRSDWISLNDEGEYLRYVLKNEEIY